MDNLVTRNIYRNTATTWTKTMAALVLPFDITYVSAELAGYAAILGYLIYLIFDYK